MDQFRDYSDSRHKGFCIHCWDRLSPRRSNRDHVPTKGILNPPYPDNLPVVEVCKDCNLDYSLDEEYLIAFLGSVLSGSTKPDPARFPKASGILAHSPKLRRRIDRSKTTWKNSCGDTKILWKPELHRMERVILKNSRGHAFFELGEPMLKKPSSVSVCQIHTMTAQEIDKFENVPHDSVWPEIGSRMMQRALVVQHGNVPQGVYFEVWQDVQEDVYRYAVIPESDKIFVRTVIYEYLATEVAWNYH